MSWQSDPPASYRIAYLPRVTPQRRWASAAMGVGAAALFIGLLMLATPAAALLLRFATILLTVALVAGVIAFMAFRIGIAPHPGSRRLGRSR